MGVWKKMRLGSAMIYPTFQVFLLNVRFYILNITLPGCNFPLDGTIQIYAQTDNTMDLEYPLCSDAKFLKYKSYSFF